MSHRVDVSWLVAVAAVACAVLGWHEQSRQGRPWTFLLPELLGGLALIAAGLLIRGSRASNRGWWLLVAAGFAWFIGDFEHSINADVAMTAFALAGWQALFLTWVLLAYPTGTLRGTIDRGLVVAAGCLLAIRTSARLFLHVPPDVAGYGTRNRFLPISDDRWWRLVEDAFAWTFSALTLLVLIAIITRWAGATRPTRRMLTPALLGSIVVAAAVAYEYVIGWNAEIPRATDVAIHDIVLWSHVALARALAAGLVRLRRTRGRVIDLVAELGDDTPPPRLGDALARALGDRSAQLLAWSAAAGGYVDGSGDVVDPSPNRPDRAVTRIQRHGEPIAVLVHDAALLEDPGLVNAVVAAVRLTTDNQQLQAELEAQLAEVAASRARIVAASDDQRRRIERDLHDGAQQRLVTVALALRLAEGRLTANADPAVRDVLTQAVKDLSAAIDELRDLARGVHPAMLTESGLVAALESLLDRSTLPIELFVDVGVEPPADVSATAYFAVSEALTNVAKHAHATHVTVRVARADDRLHVAITDNGGGGADPASGTGIRGIADRVAAVSGTLRIDSPVGAGTRFEVELPCASS